ncbi:hypothetical protein Nepgr_009261 [Nepenthes gracilis]|uniref:Uncharacterized protein n=1 Tax=Nepenthes gracilis TaxID=150966 RepID=A0AAD3SAK6_NEPGR|nr:hypothetical protein Nepgr_009261 [Nepenthes gracilis]
MIVWNGSGVTYYHESYGLKILIHLWTLLIRQDSLTRAYALDIHDLEDAKRRLGSLFFYAQHCFENIEHVHAT